MIKGVDGGGTVVTKILLVRTGERRREREENSGSK